MEVLDLNYRREEFENILLFIQNFIYLYEVKRNTERSFH